MKKILLLSGGYDSLLIYLQKKESINNFVYIDYGHRFMEKEIESMQVLDLPFDLITIKDLKDKEGFFYGRNLRFMIAVREYFLNDNICIYFGNNADDNYNDNTRYFLQDVERVINNSYPNKTMRIICPLESMTKQEIIKEFYSYKESEILKPYFCDSGKKEPCGSCHSCQAMIEANLL